MLCGRLGALPSSREMGQDTAVSRVGVRGLALKSGNNEVHMTGLTGCRPPKSPKRGNQKTEGENRMKKILALLLALTMTFSLVTVSAAAAETTYSDTKGHWAESSIDRWSDLGIVQGNHGKFTPNGNLTRGQMAAIMARLLKLPAAESAGFSDVKENDWFADAVNRCAAAGIILGTDGKAMPNDPITREQVMAMLCRAMGIEAGDAAVLADYPDVAQVSAYAAGYIASMVRMGIVKGDKAGNLNPKDYITRAEMVTILDRMITVYANEAGKTVDAKAGSVVLVVAANVKIENAPEGTIVVAGKDASGLTVNDKAVDAGKTYIVPAEETPSTPSTPSKPSEPTCEHDWVEYDIRPIGLLDTTGDKPVVKIIEGEKKLICSKCKAEKDGGPLTAKFYFAVSSGSTVDMMVDSDYTAVFTLPAEDDTVNTGSVTLAALMRNVASLGVDETRQHVLTVNTDLRNQEVVLSTWLENCYDFSGATINATIDGKACVYKFSGLENGVIFANPESVEDTRAAWQALTAGVETTTQATDDSSVTIANGSYLMMGTEMLEFESDEVGDLVLNDFSDMAALNKTIRSHVKLSTCENQDDTIRIFLAAGTKLAVGSSIAELKYGLSIDIKMDADELGVLTKTAPLATLKNTKDTTSMVKALVELFDDVIGTVDASGTVNVTMNYARPQ